MTKKRISLFGAPSTGRGLAVSGQSPPLPGGPDVWDYDKLVVKRVGKSTRFCAFGKELKHGDVICLSTSKQRTPDDFHSFAERRYPDSISAMLHETPKIKTVNLGGSVHRTWTDVTIEKHLDEWYARGAGLEPISLRAGMLVRRIADI